MRIYHQNLLPTLSNQQLQGQWRDCINLLKNWGMKNKSVDYVFKYSKPKFIAYIRLVQEEMGNRGINYNHNLVPKLGLKSGLAVLVHSFRNPIYKEHNDQYLLSDIYALKPKVNPNYLKALKPTPAQVKRLLSDIEGK